MKVHVSNVSQVTDPTIGNTATAANVSQYVSGPKLEGIESAFKWSEEAKKWAEESEDSAIRAEAAADSTEGALEGSLANAERAERAANSADVSAGKAHDSEVAAKSSEDKAKVSEEEADKSESNAYDSAIRARASADKAELESTEAEVSASKAKEEADRSEGFAKKSEEIYEAFAKGAVYRGGWNPMQSPNYPNPQETNSYWDVYLDEGTTEYEWGGIKWGSGDRLIYSMPDKQYFHIDAISGVSSVNRKTGAVVLNAEDVGALPITGGTVTGDIKSTKNIMGFRVGSEVSGESGITIGTNRDFAWIAPNVSGGDVDFSKQIAYNPVNGYWTVAGGRPYTTSYKPTSVDVGALPTAGGTMTGTIYTTKEYALIRNGSGDNHGFHMDANRVIVGSTGRDGIQLRPGGIKSSANQAILTPDGSLKLNTNSPVGVVAERDGHHAMMGCSSTTGEYLFGGKASSDDVYENYIRLGNGKFIYHENGASSGHHVYHEGRKPTPQAIGAVATDGLADRAKYIPSVDLRNDTSPSKVVARGKKGMTSVFTSEHALGISGSVHTFVDLLYMDGWNDSSGGFISALAISKSDQHKAWLMKGKMSTDEWLPPVPIYTGANKPTAKDVLAVHVKKPHTYDWTTAPAMSGKTCVGGHHTPDETPSYMSFASAGGSQMDIFVDGEVYVDNGKNKVYHEANKPTAAAVGAAPSVKNKAVFVPSGTTAQRPTSGDFPADSVALRMNTTLGEMEAVNSSGVAIPIGGGGGGGVPSFIPKDSSFTVDKKKAYSLNMIDAANKTVTIPTTFSEGDWFAVEMTRWERGTEGIYVTFDFGTGKISNGQQDSNSLVVDRPCSLYFQMIKGKWSIVDGVGVDGDYGALEKRVEKIEEYPTPWKPIEDENGAPSSLRWVRGGVFGDFPGETKWRFVDKKTIEVVGIIRVKTYQNAGTHSVMTLPSGYTFDSRGTWYGSTNGNTPSHTGSYAEGRIDTNTLTLSLRDYSDDGYYFFINWTIPLN